MNQSGRKQLMRKINSSTRSKSRQLTSSANFTPSKIVSWPLSPKIGNLTMKINSCKSSKKQQLWSNTSKTFDRCRWRSITTIEEIAPHTNRLRWNPRPPTLSTTEVTKAFWSKLAAPQNRIEWTMWTWKYTMPSRSQSRQAIGEGAVAYSITNSFKLARAVRQMSSPSLLLLWTNGLSASLSLN